MSVSQTEFRAALLDPEPTVPAGLGDGAGRAAGRRFSVYRNNVAVSLTDALEAGFPVIAKLLGAENFAGVAGHFLRAHPPRSPLMMTYGADFPHFLETFEPLRHLGYLGDVARVELAMRQSYHAADAPPINPAELQTTAPDILLGAEITLAPALRLIRSPWPVHDIWRFNTAPDAPKPRAVAQDVLVTRPAFDPAPHVLAPGGATFVEALQHKSSFGVAHDAALNEAPDFDLGATLALLLDGGAIISLTTKDPL